MSGPKTYGFTLAGKAAVITGASRGIGREIALAFAQAGANLILASRGEGQLEETAELCVDATPDAQIEVVVTDVTRADDLVQLVSRAEQRFGRIDVLVNNAGGQNVKPLLELTDDEIADLVHVNLLSAVTLTRLVGKRMTEAGGGSIINMSSIYAFVGASGTSIYSATKGALLSFGRAMAVEWARYGVRVNSLCPGWVETELIRDYIQDDATVQAAKRQIPLRRFANPQEVAPLAVYLASDASSYITGQGFIIDGGQTAR
jgi:NAD(P)-dependent dehydrogenase (short-subunit alcohol dehydrogenase family)